MTIDQQMSGHDSESKPGSPSGKNRLFSRDVLLLVLVLLGGGMLRVLGLDFGLPHPNVRPDELTMIARVMNFYSGDLNPHFFSYPSLQMYLLFGFYNLYFLLGLVGGQFGSLRELIGEYATDPSYFFLISRGLSALMGTLSILVIYRLAQRCFDRSTGTLAALFLAFAYLHVRESHFGTTDITVTFFVLWSYLFIMSAYRTGSGKDYALAGLFAGFATSTKYMGALLWVPMVLVNILGSEPGRRNFRRLLDRRLLKFGVVFAVSFVVGTPFVITDGLPLLRGFVREVKAVWIVREGLEIGWIFHLTTSLRHGLGLPLLAGALCGVWVLFRQRWREAMVFLSFPILYYLLMGRGFRDFVRYAIPVVPFLCVTAAVCLVFLHRTISNRLAPVVRTPLLWGMTVLMVYPSILNVIRFDALLTKPDTRLEAREFVQGTVPAQSSIVEFPVTFGELGLYPTVQVLEREVGRELDGSIKRLVLEARLDHLKAKKIRGYELWGYDPQDKHFVFEGDRRLELPKVFILQRSPLRRYNPTVPEEIADLLGKNYSLEKEFLGVGKVGEQAIFNELDALYIPFAGFENSDRMGPDIFIYELIEPGPV